MLFSSIKTTLFCLVLSSSLLACADKPSRRHQQTSHTTLSAGTYQFELAHNQVTRRYMLHIPKRYSANKPAPMVLSLHGGLGNMTIQANDKAYQIIAKSEQAGFIAVFPNGYSRLRSGKFATWNAGTCCGKAESKQSDDVGYIKKVIEEVKKRVNIDTNRIYANGMSNGAMMSYRLACELSDIIAAIGAVAGTDNTKNCRPNKPVSVIHIHALNDDHVPFNGGVGAKSLAKVSFQSVPDTIKKWVAINHCHPTPRRMLLKKSAYCDLYTGCLNHTQVKLCVTDTGGHSWPGTQTFRKRQDTPAKTINATDLIWDFYQSNSAH